MQTQTQVPEQSPGPLQNETSHNSGMQGLWRRWQSESDTNLRRDVVENILQLFKNWKPHVTPEWQQRLPDFVKRLEEALYRSAATKEEYVDASTLEQRLQIVTKRLVRKPQQASQVVSSSAVGNMIPTPGTTPSNMMPTPGTGSNMMSMPGNSSSMTLVPGSTGNLMLPGGGGGGGGSLSSMMSVTGNGNNSFMNPMSHGSGTMMPAPGTNISNMIPTPEHASNNMFGGVSGSNMMSTPGSAGMNSLGSSQQAAIGGGLRLSQNGLVASSMGMGVSNQMISTPGLTSSQGMSISPAPSSAGLPDMSGVTPAQLQQYGGGGVNDHYPGLNGHM